MRTLLFEVSLLVSGFMLLLLDGWFFKNQTFTIRFLSPQRLDKLINIRFVKVPAQLFSGFRMV